MKLTKEDVGLYRHLARKNFIETSSSVVWHDGMPVSEGDFVAIAQLRAALATLGAMNLVSSDTVLELSEPFVEIFDE